MTVQRFRLLLISSLIVAVIAGCIDFVFPSLMPDAFHQAQQAHESSLSMVRILSHGVLGIIFLCLTLASIYGLYMLRSWAPRLALAVTVNRPGFCGGSTL